MMASTQQQRSYDRYRQIQRVLWIVLFLNLVVALAKYFYGLWTGSVSMKADGIASMFDTASNLIGIVGMHLASRPADVGHPYGHAKFETYASAVIGVMLLLAAYNVATDAFLALTGGATAVEVNVGSFAVMAGTLVINVFVSSYERRRGSELTSEILTADAMHTMSDAFVSISVIVGLVFAAMGFPIADPISSIVVAIAILRSAYEVFKQANATLSDEARIPVADVEAVVEGVEGVRSCHKVRTRGTEGEVYADLHVLVDPNMPIVRAHAVGDVVEAQMRAAFPQVVDVVVHLEPDIPSQRMEDDDALAAEEPETRS